MKKAFRSLGIVMLLLAIIQIARMYYSGSSIPEYEYLGLEGNYHSKKELPNTPVIFVYFSPECGFCENVIGELKVMNKKSDISINYVFVTNQKSKEIVNNFIMANSLNKLTNFVFIDEKDTFPVDFGMGMIYSTPTILVYNKYGKFVKKLTNYKEIKSIKV